MDKVSKTSDTSDLNVELETDHILKEVLNKKIDSEYIDTEIDKIIREIKNKKEE